MRLVIDQWCEGSERDHQHRTLELWKLSRSVASTVTTCIV